MTLKADVVFEVRTGGADDNGGGFDAVSGTPGTDRSVQTSPHATFTDLVIDGSDNTKCTSAATPFASDDVGNIINITSGTNWTVQRVQILSVAATVATCDKSLGTTGSTGGNGKLGGCLLTIGKATGLETVPGMVAYVRGDGGTYSISSGITTGTANSSSTITRLIGYTTTRGDGGQPTILTTAAIVALTVSGGRSWSIENFLIDCNDTGTKGLHINQTDSYGHNVKAIDATTIGIHVAAGVIRVYLTDCEVSGCAGTAGIFHAGSGSLFNCWSHDNTVTGIILGTTNTSGQCWFCRSTNNTGASSDGFEVNFYTGAVMFCVAYKNGRDGIRKVGFNSLWAMIQNNILAKNTGTGLNFTTAQSSTLAAGRPNNDYNAYWSNTGPERANVDAGANDVTLSVDPFTDVVTDDYTLNNTAGGGAACRAAGLPANHDIGVFQHADPAGGGSSNLLRGKL